MDNTQLSKMDSKEWYISNFEILEGKMNGGQNMPIHSIRKKALQKFSELGFPTIRNEAWKYTNVKQIVQHDFKWPDQPSTISENTISKYRFKDINQNVLVFVNGFFNQELSNIDAANDGIIITNLANALKENAELVNKHISFYAKYDTEAFAALNTAFVHDGSFVYIPDGKVLDHPIHFLYISDSGDEVYHAHPRNLFVVGKNSQCHLLESYHHISDKHYFNNSVTEIAIDESGIVEHIKIQDESEAGYHISSSQVSQEKNSTYTSVNIDLGGALVRNNLSVLLNGEYCESNLYGFSMAHNNQHIDNHTLMDHAVPNCNSNESYKAILDDQARGVFNGKVMVREDAQKTNAFQSNKTLLLTDQAIMNTKPQLEIFADDVKCSHGATIGQLDEDALFYLRARGISEEMAHSMLRFAFAEDVLEKIKFDVVHKKLTSIIHNKFMK